MAITVVRDLHGQSNILKLRVSHVLAFISDVAEGSERRQLALGVVLKGRILAKANRRLYVVKI